MAAPDDALREFLELHPPHAEAREEWPVEPPAAMSVRLCLASSLPPREFISSVLAIVTHGDSVLFINPGDPTGSIAHVVIGGRAEGHETPVQTVRREVLEETGWVVDPARIIGFRHVRHLGPPHPQLADRPFPEFVQPVYAAVARGHDPAAKLPKDAAVALVDAAWALAATDEDQRPLLAAALRAHLGRRRV